jgi:hypothetical protein
MTTRPGASDWQAIFFPHMGVLLKDHGITWVWLFNSLLENLHNTCSGPALAKVLHVEVKPPT